MKNRDEILAQENAIEYPEVTEINSCVTEEIHKAIHINSQQVSDTVNAAFKECSVDNGDDTRTLNIIKLGETLRKTLTKRELAFAFMSSDSHVEHLKEEVRNLQSALAAVIQDKAEIKIKKISEGKLESIFNKLSKSSKDLPN